MDNNNNKTLTKMEINLSEYMLTILTFIWFISVVFCIVKIQCCKTCKDKCITYMKRKKLNRYIIHENINDICPICIENFEYETIVKLDCNHVYHKDCLEMWIINGNNDECPYCRKIIQL
jgi:hypothetical protein